MTFRIAKTYLSMATICLASTSIFLSSALANNDSELTIGSEAPGLDIEHWLSDGDGKFQHTTTLEPGKIYVIEFWATWCGPCIAAMPKISELQDEFAERGVQIISVSDEELDIVEPFLSRQVRGKPDLTYGQLTSNYCLTTDPDKSVFNDYFRAAGQSGIPCCFIVGKTGLIEWIGHPMRMLQPLQQVVSNEWDRDAFREAFEEEKRQEQLRQQAERKIMQAMRTIENMIEDGNAEDAIEIFDDLIADENLLQYKSILETLRRQTLITQIGGEQGVKAIEEYKKSNKDDPQALNELAWGIYERQMQEGDISDEIMAEAIKTAELAIKVAPRNGAIYDTLAHLVYESGNLDRALELQEMAMKFAGGMESEIEPFLKKLRQEKKDKNKQKENETGKNRQSDN